MAKESKSNKQAASKPPKSTPTPVKVYLVAYNALSAVGWAYVLTLVLVHLFDLDGKSGSFTAVPKSTAGFFSRILPFLDSKTGAVQSNLPPWLKPIHTRATTTYGRAGAATAFVQSFAALEVLHAALGWVRSPVPTTAMQVASRLFLVWGIMAQFTGVRTNALFASMVFAWSFTEVIRYTFYALNLLGYNPPFLLWLRYTTFYILYPLGAGSEAFLMYFTLPDAAPITLAHSIPTLTGAWSLGDYGRAILFTIWWPGLYFMYTYMISQRRKVLGPAKPPKTKSS
ncbi:hypothetical protein EST38_g11548 [Candolleomyces aberdarensis]|uniref:Very-long-chain (3R)-3-hydroxyacyl-CoA dehydratase n=1 Tax=Candolleomyces aberdarensis TaxID=2316362 RepID=A0A4Q2D625_9AGAR|nr:hypothetical protein EST38_g11548 [Candolleomyces aberdarensis]